MLSLMLHVLVIVLFGDATGGGARRGEKLWGALTVTVRSLLPEPGVALKLDRASTTLQWPTTEPQPAPTLPGIAPEKLDRRASEATQQAPPVEEPALPAQAPSFEMPPLISKDVEKPVTEFVVPKPSTDRAYTPPTAQVPREAPATPPPVIAPAAILPPVFVAPAAEPIAPIKVERALVTPLLPISPVELKPREELVAPPTLAPEPLPPKIEREIVRPIVSTPAPKPREVAPPVVQPAAPVAPVTPIATAVPPKPERESVQPVAVPAEAKPREIPVADGRDES